MNSTASIFAPVAVSNGDPIRLAMQRLWLTGQVLPAGARIVVEHLFQSQEEQPLEVIYSFALPTGASLRGFRITGDGFESCSELMPTEDAVKAYEHGIAHGSLSALARQYRDGLVNLTVGNIRSKETVTVRLEILGDSRGVRAGRTIAAIFAFVAEGHTRSAGAFRLHVERLVRFLKSIGAESETERRVMEKALETASRGNVPPGQWLALANESGTRWKQIEAALNLIP